MTCFLAGMLTVTGVSAGQVDDVPPQTNGRGRSGYMGYRVEHGDTAYYDSIDPAWIFPKGYRGTKRDLKRYYRLVYNFNKVYPYALLAKDMESQADRHIAQNSLRRRIIFNNKGLQKRCLCRVLARRGENIRTEPQIQLRPERGRQDD